MTGRLRAACATLTSAPWRRGPWLLRRSPGVLLAVAGAAAVMAASLAAVPLFSSSVGTASVTLQAEERCPRDTGATWHFDPSPTALRAPAPDPFRPVDDRLGPSSWWVRLNDVYLFPDDAARLRVNLLVRDGVLDHVEVLERGEGSGVWISDRAVDLTGLHAGDVTTIGATRVPVVGVYRDLSGSSVDDFWCSNANLLLVGGPDLSPPPPLVLIDRTTLAELMVDLEVDTATEGVWEAALRPGLTVTEVDELAGVLACRDGVDALAWCVDGHRPPGPGPATGPFGGQTVEAREEADFIRRFLGSSMPFVVDRSRAIQTSVGSGIWATAGLAALAGVGLVVAAASLWFERRRRELVLLTVRGVSPAGLGVKAVLELAAPLVVGVALGVALAYAGVVWLGPSPILEPSAIGRAVVIGGLALAGGVATVAGVVSVRARPAPTPRRRHRALAAVPWELLLGWLTVVSYRRLGEWGLPVGRGADVSRVDLWGLLFPVLFLVTAVAVLSRSLGVSVRPLRRLSRSWPTPLYLGVRRVARHRVAAIALLSASAVSAGVLAYSATMNRSLDASLDAKARTFVGSDVAVHVPGGTEVPPALTDDATEVRMYYRAWVMTPQRLDVRVVAIDPASFESVAFWDDSFADAPLAEILAGLAERRDDGRVPAVVVGAPIGNVEVELAGTTRTRFDIVPLHGVTAFPGMARVEPTVFVDAAALDDSAVVGAEQEVWVTGDRDDILGAFGRAGIQHRETRTFAGVADRASFLTVSWTFGFLQSLGVAAGLLVAGSVAVYLDSRRRQRLLGYALMRRMGLTGGEHRRALALELAATVVVGSWTGLGIAAAGAALAYTRVDPVPGFPPGPLLRLPLVPIAVLAAATVVLAGAAVARAQRRIAQDDPLEVLRAGG